MNVERAAVKRGRGSDSLSGVTWFANEILAPAVAGLVEEVVGFASYREAAHVISSIESFGFYDEAVRHGLPPEGLMVVRPVGEPRRLERWYRVPVVPWLPPPGWELVELAVTPAHVSALHAEAAHLPPEDFLRALKGLARRHDTTVAYGYFSTWGGCNELEYVWIFGVREAVLINTSSEPTHLVFEQGQPSRLVDRPLVQELADALGMSLPTSFFAPHARKFRWRDFLKVPARS